MNFQSKTEKQLNEERLMPAGVYPFEVIRAEDKTSKAGNEMIELEVRLFLPDGRSRMLNDFLMEKMAFKLFHFCAYTGLSIKYEAGTLQSHDCIGRTGYAKVEIRVDKKGQYPDQNSIADYVRTQDGMKKGGVVASRPQPSDDEMANVGEPKAGDGEDVPF